MNSLPPLDCHARGCRRPATYAVTGDTASAPACTDHVDAIHRTCGPGHVDIRRLPDAPEPEQPSLYQEGTM